MTLASQHPPQPAQNTDVCVPKRARRSRLPHGSWLADSLTSLVFGKPLAPSREEWDDVVESLWRSDPPMDSIVEWMFEGRPGHAKAQFEQALTRGIDSLENPTSELTEFFARVDNAPPWLDRGLLERGARVAQAAGMVNFYVLRDMALMGGYAYFNSMNQTLAATGALQKSVALRLGETGKWLDDVTKPHGLDRFGDGFITTIRVRMVHALVRRALKKRGDWDAASWGEPINQADMLATYLAFGPVTLLGARVFGVPVSRKDSRSALHMWRYIGWLSGVEEPRLALTERDGLRKLYHTSLTHRMPDEKVGLLGAALLNEPFTRHLPALERYPWLLSLARRYIYHKHLSNASLILGPAQRRRLGLPLLAFPWYPLVSAPWRFVATTWYRWRGGDALAKRNQRSAEKQQRLLASYFEGREANIIVPTPEHPAHVT